MVHTSHDEFVIYLPVSPSGILVCFLLPLLPLSPLHSAASSHGPIRNASLKLSPDLTISGPSLLTSAACSFASQLPSFLNPDGAIVFLPPQQTSRFRFSLSHDTSSVSPSALCSSELQPPVGPGGISSGSLAVAVPGGRRELRHNGACGGRQHDGVRECRADRVRDPLQAQGARVYRRRA